MTDNDATVSSDQIRISIEVGADYAMSDALASLLQQVQGEVSDDEVSGHGMLVDEHQLGAVERGERGTLAVRDQRMTCDRSGSTASPILVQPASRAGSASTRTPRQNATRPPISAAAGFGAG